ncbi:hypothetical protein EZS27_041929, partial [termite gut metagenome]
LRLPGNKNPNKLEEAVRQEKMSDVFKEYLNWGHIMGLSNVGEAIELTDKKGGL